MLIIIVLLSLSLVLCLLSVGIVYYKLKTLKQKYDKLRKEPTYDCQQLLSDIGSGYGMVSITRINPNDVFLHNPRGKR